MRDRSVVYVVVLGLVLVAGGVAAADALTRDEKRFLRRIGCTPEVLERNDCRIELIDPEGEVKPRNMMLDCDYPLTIRPKQSCLTATCQ